MTNWAVVSDVRRMGQISDTDFTDAEIQEFISLAQKEVNSKISNKVIRERVYFIDSARPNTIDGTNATFYIRNWKGNYLSDFDYDNVVDVNDVTVVIYDRNTLTETTYNPTSISIDNCSFTMTTAPSNCDIYVTYAYSPLDPVYPTPFITQCVSYLAGSYLFVGTDGFEFQFGNVRIKPGLTGGKGKQLWEKYNELLRQLIVISNGGAIVGDMYERI